MGFLKSKIKRMVLGLSLVASMLFSAVPALAAEEVASENVTNETEAVASESPSVDLATVIADIALEPRAGNETWTGSGFGGSYTFTDYNLTPVKTMGASGTLLIYGSFYGNDGYASASPIKLTAQIRSTSGAIKAQTVEVDTRNGNIDFSMACSVSKGEQIQLFFDASSIANPPGILRSAFVSYNYDLF